MGMRMRVSIDCELQRFALASGWFVDLKTNLSPRSKFKDMQNYEPLMGIEDSVKRLCLYRADDDFQYMKVFRMDGETYKELLRRVYKIFEVDGTGMDCFKRLSLMLDYFATGRTPDTLRGDVITKTCAAFILALSKDYLAIPNTQDKWKSIANEFQSEWDVPNCLGSITTLRVRMVPKLCLCMNSKETTTVLLAADAQHRISFAEIDHGPIPDEASLMGSQFNRHREKGTLNLPVLGINGDKPVSFVASGDFQAREWLRVLSGAIGEEKEEILRGLRPVETVKKILFTRFGILQTTCVSIHLQPVLTCVFLLHNFFMAKNPAYSADFKD